MVAFYPVALRAKKVVHGKAAVIFGRARPAWRSTLQFVHKRLHPGTASIFYANERHESQQPMHYIAIDARRYNCTPISTFDQPLVEIIYDHSC